ncbi:hypothetical protein ACFVQ4_05285 [Streptomyces laurentii]|uniref:hypothetical protein n=1 Tax=Streptomyces laurentii TaxID=39478 RepID=UPI00369A10C7
MIGETVPDPKSSDENPRESLGNALKRLLMRALGDPFRLRDVIALSDGPLPHGVLQDWLSGQAAPTAKNEEKFWAVVRAAEARAGKELESEEWEAGLRAAQRQSAHRSPLSWHSQVKKWQTLTPPGGLDDREAEQKVMDAFVAASGPEAPSYLCWHSKLAVGKTSLLAVFAAKPPRKVDVVHVFLSEARTPPERAEFLTQLTKQIKALFPPTEKEKSRSRDDHLTSHEPKGKAATDPRRWGAYLNRAAAASGKRGRRFLLVVDGLDEDVAWDVTDGLEDQAESSIGERRRRRGPGSIAALLPTAPHANLRIIASVRRPVGLPADVAPGHPLRQATCLRHLGHSPRAGEVEQEASTAADRMLGHPLGRSVLGLLVVAGSGLRVADLAELTGSSPEEVGQVIHGPDGRCVVLDDPRAATYILSHPGLLASLRRRLGPDEVARHTTALHAWVGTWQRRAEWPEGTSPYVSTGHLRLLDDPVDRTEYVLDPHRLLRLAMDTGADVALAQVDASRSELARPQIAVAARSAALSSLLADWTHEVPPEAVALCVRLGDMERALTLARSGPDPATTARQLALLAVEMGRAELPDVVSVAAEAAVWAGRLGRTPQRPVADTDTADALAASAHALRKKGRTDAARVLFQAAVLGGANDIETVAAAASLLSEKDGQDWLKVLDARADDLTMGGPRARAAAVDIWAAIAEVDDSRLADVRSRIVDLCEEAESDPELASVDVLVVGARALVSRKKVAPRLVRTALDRLSGAMRDPGSLPEADRAYLRRDVSTTLARLGLLMRHTEIGWHAHDQLQELTVTHERWLSEGALGDDLAERARENMAAAEDEKQARDAERQRQVQRRKAHQVQQRKAHPRDPDQARWKTPRGRTSAAEPDPPARPLGVGPGQPARPALFRRAAAVLDDGNPFLARELVRSALVPLVPLVRTPPPAAPGASLPWLRPLLHALGVVGEAGQARSLFDTEGDPLYRAHCLTALSLGCSEGGCGDEAGRSAQEAARLAAGGGDPVTRAVVAQALAYAGDSSGAARSAPPEALAAVAAGLVRHDPRAAANLVAPVVEALGQRLREGSLTNPLPRVAELLLAGPDVRRPDRALHELLREVATEACLGRQGTHDRTMVLLALLERLGVETEAPSLLDTSRLRSRATASPRFPTIELAVLRAVEGDIAEARRLAETASSPDGRAAVLAVVATYLAGVPTVLGPRRCAPDAVPRLCLALAHAAGDGTAPDEGAAREIVLELLADGAGWVRAIPLLPRLAPKALVPITGAVRAFRAASREQSAPQT